MALPPTPVFIDAPSPNFDARTSPPSILVLHYTGMKTGPEALTRLCDPTPPRVSAHYVVEEDGTLYRLVAEERRAWHAGVSCWRGERDVNGASIGVEVVNPGHDWGYRPFPDPQIDAVITLLDDIRSRWIIADPDIVGHSDVAPGRKADPGELFPWDRLHAHGHGVWVSPQSAPGEQLKEGDEGVGVFALQAGLARIGYDSPPSGLFDADTRDRVTAFQRHWRPTACDGVADGQTRATLMAVLRAASQA
jgi:N-acetylmuramoyl-L-alanine amidase